MRGAAGAYPERMRAVLGLLADVCCVLAFVVIGRANHHAGETVAGVASTAWPFLAGLACGEVAARPITTNASTQQTSASTPSAPRTRPG